MKAEERFAKLNEAMDLITAVQVDMAVAEDRIEAEERSGRWRELYGLRVKLGNFIALQALNPEREKGLTS